MYGYEGLKVVREPAGVDVHRCYRRLVMAVAAQWVKDARYSRTALVDLADWAEVPVDVLEVRVSRLRAAGSQWRFD